METDKNFLLKVVKDILDGKNPDNALNQLKEQLTALGYVPE